MKQGAGFNLSTLHTTVHLGAHADAPNHYGTDGRTIDTVDLNYYLGECQVITVRVGQGSRIFPKHIVVPITSERVLFHTDTFPNPNLFNEDFAAFSADLVDYLHQQGVILVGIDTPSVDPFSSPDMPAHKAFLKGTMMILEGLVLNEVPDGVYELIALPLKLVGFDASPVRAILRRNL
jgi:arylformamidase